MSFTTSTLNAGVEGTGRPPLALDQAVDQARVVVRSGADVLKDRHAGGPVVLADEAAFAP